MRKFYFMLIAVSMLFVACPKPANFNPEPEDVPTEIETPEDEKEPEVTEPDTPSETPEITEPEEIPSEIPEDESKETPEVPEDNPESGSEVEPEVKEPEEVPEDTPTEPKDEPEENPEITPEIPEDKPIIEPEETPEVKPNEPSEETVDNPSEPDTPEEIPEDKPSEEPKNEPEEPEVIPTPVVLENVMNLQSTVVGDKIKLTWDNPSDDRLTKFYIDVDYAISESDGLICTSDTDNSIIISINSEYRFTDEITFTVYSSDALGNRSSGVTTKSVCYELVNATVDNVAEKIANITSYGKVIVTGNNSDSVFLSGLKSAIQNKSRLLKLDISEVTGWTESTDMSELDTNQIVELKLPNDMQSIKEYAFTSCTDLEVIELPKSLRRISYNPFNNTKITSFVVPESVESLSTAAFTTGSDFTVTFEDNTSNWKFYNSIRRINTNKGAMDESATGKFRLIENGQVQMSDYYFKEGSKLKPYDL